MTQQNKMKRWKKQMMNEQEISNKISNKLDKVLVQNKEDIKNMILDCIYSTINSERVELENKQSATPVIPNNKVVISAKLFSEIVNLSAFAENNGFIEEGFLQKITNDVKENRHELEQKHKNVEPESRKEENEILKRWKNTRPDPRKVHSFDKPISPRDFMWF